MPSRLTSEIITAAIDGFEAQKNRIDTQIVALRAMLAGDGAKRVTVAVVKPATRKRRKLSAAARKRIGDAQRKRWAASRKQSHPIQPISAEPPRRKRKPSAAGRRAIIAGTKRRWAAIKAAQEAARKSVATKASRNKAA
jgi:hypothetical protein